MTTLDDVIETVRAAREDGPEALAAMALSYGATMALGTLRIAALRGQIAELRAAMAAAERERDEARAERDALRARPTHEARTTAPTPEECAAHGAAGGVWYTTGGTSLSCEVVAHPCAAHPSAHWWLPLDASGLPCSWPVPSAEVTP